MSDLFTILGDPHLGRSFIRNVPLHRRGEREAMVWKDFESSVLNCNTPMHICMGDLFDKWSVSYDTIARAARTYLEAAEKTETVFVVLQGNHDASRDLTRTSAFDLFAAIVGHRPNIHVVREALSLGGQLFLGWQPIVTAEDHFLGNHTTETTCFGHWDVDGATPNLIPVSSMARAGVTSAYTGHIHKPISYVSNGVAVSVTGSMQPYAHGEGDMYVTVGLDEVRDHPEYYRNKCVRIELDPAEVLDFSVDCLSLQTVRREDVRPDTEVVYSQFDMASLFAQAFETEAVPDAITREVLDKFRNV